MSVAKRTSISMDPGTLAKGQDRARKLGYPSLSEYIGFLIQRDAHEKPRHIITRDESSTIHEASPAGYTTERATASGGSPVSTSRTAAEQAAKDFLARAVAVESASAAPPPPYPHRRAAAQPRATRRVKHQ